MIRSLISVLVLLMGIATSQAGTLDVSRQEIVDAILASSANLITASDFREEAGASISYKGVGRGLAVTIVGSPANVEAVYLLAHPTNETDVFTIAKVFANTARVAADWSGAENVIFGMMATIAARNASSSEEIVRFGRKIVITVDLPNSWQLSVVQAD